MNNNRSPIEQQLLQITRQLLKDCHHYGAIRELNLNSDLEKELGMGSIEKSELFYRIESVLGIQLPEILLAEAATLRELCDAIVKTSPFIKPLPTAHSPIIEATEIDPLRSKTLIQAIENHVEKEPNRPHVFIQNDRGEEKLITYQLLYESAKKIAAQLQKLGLDSEQTVAIMLPTSEDFFYAYFGVLLAGGIPVPIYPPFRRNKLEDYIHQESKILRNSQVSFLITFKEVATLSHLLTSFVPSLQHVVTLQDLEKIGNCTLIVPNIKPESPALIQYTSGSTGDPKGVLLSHYNLVSNISCAAKSIGIKPTDQFVSWLPLYHDMGLIGTWLGSLYFGLPLTLLSALTFLSRPEKWLWAIHYHRATLSPAPNFGYELCLNKIHDRHLEGLDLRSWRLAFNGAEAVYPSTLRRFAKRFAKYGFDQKALYPCYGLAENSVALCFPPAGRGPLYDKVKRDEFDQFRKATPANPTDKNVHEFVSCGQPIIGHDIRIVDSQNNPLPERSVGQVQFRGPSMMQGYFLNPKATADIVHEGWTDTGDLAYLAQGELFITGRQKDIIIKAGRNLYPAEIEEIIGNIEGVRKGCVTAFGYQNLRNGTEEFVVIAESHQKGRRQKRALRASIISTLVDHLGLPPDVVMIVPPGRIPKTSSGKLQRAETKKLYLGRKLLHSQVPAGFQMLKILTKSILQRCESFFKTALKALYTLYMVIVFILDSIPGFLLIVSLPKLTARVTLKIWCKVLFFLGFCRIKVVRESKAPTPNLTIYVSNHASYMDSLLLISALPNNVVFVPKDDLEKSFILSRVLKHVGYLTVNRLNFLKSLEGSKKIKNTLANKESVLIFPEGTFTPATGVRPFRLGAFQLAVDLQIPITPVAIRGTRKLLRGGKFLLTPSQLDVWIGEPIMPTSSDFSEIIRLRNELRNVISQACKERTINLVRAGPE